MVLLLQIRFKNRVTSPLAPYVIRMEKCKISRTVAHQNRIFIVSEITVSYFRNNVTCTDT